jgi:autotransporter-associated beta strand protein
VDISGLSTPGTTAGFIRTDDVGSNFFRLGSKTLTVGGSNASTVVSGVIADGGVAGGVGGSIVKVGTGTMTYGGPAANTYTGTTFVNEGRLVLNKVVEAIRGPLVIGDGVGAVASAVVEAIGNPNNIQDSQAVTVNRDGDFVLGFGLPEVIGTLTVDRGFVSMFSTARLTVGGPLTMTGGTLAQAGGGTPATIVLGNAAIHATSTSDELAAIIAAPIDLTTSHAFTVGDGPGATDLLVSGNIGNFAAVGSIVKSGAGLMILSGTNQFTGSTTLAEGTLSVSSDLNLGSPTSRLVFDGGTLQTTAGFTLNSLRGITLNAGGGAIEVTRDLVTYLGIIAGEGSLTKTGTGILGIGGAAGNTYTGTTTVNEGILALSKTALNQAILGPLVIGDGIGATNSAAVVTGNQISDTAAVTIWSDGRLEIGNFSNEAIGSLTIAGGNVVMGITSVFSIAGAIDMSGGRISSGNATLLGNVAATSDAAGHAATITSNTDLGGATRTFTVNDGPGNIDLAFSNPIGNGGITKTGAGTLALDGANSYAGLTTIIAGRLLLTGNISGSTTVIANSATLQGTGTTGPLTINSGATLIPGLNVGTLTTGNLTLSAGSTVAFDLAVANVVGSGINELVNINGNFTLDGTLVVTELPGFGEGTYPLFDYSGTLTNNGLEPEAGFLAMYPGSFIEIDTSNTRVNLVVVPEAGALLLTLSGGAALTLRRYRRGGNRGKLHGGLC